MAETTSTKSEISSLQAARAFAALSVLLFHTETVLASSAYLNRSIFPIFEPGRAGVELFFVLSGFVITLAHAKDLGHPQRAGAFLWKRFRRVYPPLWIALLGVLPVFLFMETSISGTNKINLANVALAFLIAPAPYESLLWVEWTLRHEVLFYACFALGLWKVRLGLTVFIAWMALSLLLGPQVSTFPLSFLASPYNLLFGMGVLIAVFYLRGFVWRPVVLLAVGLVCFFATWSLNLAQILANDFRSNWLYGLGAAMILLGAAERERRSAIRLPRILALLGEASYAIYLVHLPIVSVMSKISKKASDAGAPDVVLFVATAAVSLAGGVLFHLLLEKPLLARLPRSLAQRSGKKVLTES